MILLYTTCAFQLLDLFLNWDWSIYLADYGQPTSKYIRVKPSDAISLLEKWVHVLWYRWIQQRETLRYHLCSIWMYVLRKRYMIKSISMNYFDKGQLKNNASLVFWSYSPWNWKSFSQNYTILDLVLHFVHGWNVPFVFQIKQYRQ